MSTPARSASDGGRTVGFGPRVAAALIAVTLALAATPEAGAQTSKREGGSPPASPPSKTTPGEKSAPHAGDTSSQPNTDAQADAKAAAARDPLKRPLPDTPQQRARLLDDLYAMLATAEDERAAGPIVQAIARVWLSSGSETIDLLMQRALKAMKEKKYPLARTLLNSVVELAPDYAEGWSSRGQLFYLENDVQRALGDLRRAIALDPNHFKALDGLGTIFREIGQKRAALKAYEQLLSVHPFWSGAKQAYEELKREVEGQGI